MFVLQLRSKKIEWVYYHYKCLSGTNDKGAASCREQILKKKYTNYQTDILLYYKTFIPLYLRYAIA